MYEDKIELYKEAGLPAHVKTILKAKGIAGFKDPATRKYVQSLLDRRVISGSPEVRRALARVKSDRLNPNRGPGDFLREGRNKYKLRKALESQGAGRKASPPGRFDKIKLPDSARRPPVGSTASPRKAPPRPIRPEVLPAPPRGRLSKAPPSKVYDVTPRTRPAPAPKSTRARSTALVPTRAQPTSTGLVPTRAQPTSTAPVPTRAQPTSTAPVPTRAQPTSTAPVPTRAQPTSTAPVPTRATSTELVPTRARPGSTPRTPGGNNEVPFYRRRSTQVAAGLGAAGLGAGYLAGRQKQASFFKLAAVLRRSSWRDR